MKRTYLYLDAPDFKKFLDEGMVITLQPVGSIIGAGVLDSVLVKNRSNQDERHATIMSINESDTLGFKQVSVAQPEGD